MLPQSESKQSFGPLAFVELHPIVGTGPLGLLSVGDVVSVSKRQVSSSQLHLEGSELGGVRGWIIGEVSGLGRSSLDAGECAVAGGVGSGTSSARFIPCPNRSRSALEETQPIRHRSCGLLVVKVSKSELPDRAV